uniref:T9SS type A sorting domain-containing protein n=1 Tax=Flavobacterium sp. TaxID=239 RepID=UPI00404AE35E
MKKIFYVIITLFFSLFGFSQSNFWTPIESRLIDETSKIDRDSEPIKFQTYHLEIESLKNLLNQAPDRKLNQNSDLIMTFPLANGSTENFRVYEASIMHPDLASRYPEIQSYVGFGTRDKTAMIRFSTTLFGFHGIIFSAKTGTSYIDTYTEDLNYYIVYKKKDVVSNRSFECLVNDEFAEENQPIHFSPRNNNSIESNTGLFRTYRLAMACTVEYAAFHINAANANAATLEQKKAVVLSAMNVTMTRVNGLYEKDMSLTMELIPNNDAIIFVDNDNFNNNNASQLINQSQTAIDAAIGSFNYDIGHTVSTGGGGLAQLNSPCSASKARGITGLPSPVGDPFDIDYVAHEIGHQFGATHTFNNSCNGNRSNNTAVEPGSGNTIMGYAGICAPNVQNNSDAHFHSVSLAQMDAFVASFGNCSNNVQNFNDAPVIDFIPNYTIPASTPFILPGNATDENNQESLTYCWEQINNQISTQPPFSNNTSGPSFRSLPPSESPNRYLPNLDTVLTGATQNTWEVLPSVSRNMNFSLTVRDNGEPLGGQTNRRDISVVVSNTGIPFQVTSQNQANISWIPGENEVITWDVANTTSAPINTQNVDILLSTDGGLNFDYVLLQNTPNDGSEQIIVPNDVASQFCRIMVKSVNNIFYNVNLSNFSIGTDCESFSNTDVIAIPDGNGNNVAGTTLVRELLIENIDGLISSLSVDLNINHSWIGDLVIDLEHPDGTTRRIWNRNCNNPQNTNIQATFRDGNPAIVCSTPTMGVFSPFESFDAFLNKPKAGIWKLHLTDFYNQDAGTLNSWAIDFGCTLNQNSFAENKFSIFPNPNQGSFSIRNDFSLPNETNIQIYDMSGRLIFQQIGFEPNASSQIDISLNNVQTGAYFVMIRNGEIKETHKIIIE